MRRAFDVAWPSLLRLVSENSSCLAVSLGFFDDIYIPTAYLPQPSCLFVSRAVFISDLLTRFFIFLFENLRLNNPSSDTSERAHFWLGPDSPFTAVQEMLESPLSSRMYIDQNDVVRARVEADEFCDDEPGPPNANPQAAAVQMERRAPYCIIVRTFRAAYKLSCHQNLMVYCLVLDCRARIGTYYLVEDEPTRRCGTSAALR